MRDLLVPIFGEWGAVIAQFLLTVIIVLGLIGAVWWFVRRYSGVHFGGIGRGRVPRLAVIDVMPVDRRRRLVLVRRDNVEHLLLLGGPSDIVVEGAIHRVRPRTAQQAAQVAAARAAMQSAIEAQPDAAQLAAPQPEAVEDERTPANAPIPFPAGRSTPPQPVPAHAAPAEAQSMLRPLRRQPAPPPAAADVPAEEPQSAPPAARAAEPQRPTRLQAWRVRPAAASEPPSRAQAPAPVPTEPQPAAGAIAEHDILSEVMTVEAEPSLPPAAQPFPTTFAEAEWEAAEAARQAALDLGDTVSDAEAPAPATAEEEMPTAPIGDDGQPAPPDPAARVTDLEREMARLLDEITTRRSS